MYPTVGVFNKNSSNRLALVPSAKSTRGSPGHAFRSRLAYTTIVLLLYYLSGRDFAILNAGVKIVEYDPDQKTVRPGTTFEEALLLLKRIQVPYQHLERGTHLEGNLTEYYREARLAVITQTPV